MQAHDPMWDLQGLVDRPVSPDPAFTNDLRQTIFTDLDAARRAEETPDVLRQLEASGRIARQDVPDKNRRRIGLLVLGQLALVALILLGTNLAIESDNWRSATVPFNGTQWGASAPPPVLLPGAAPTSPPVNRILWQQSPGKDASAVTTGMVLLDSRIARFVSSDTFEGIIISSINKGKEKARIALGAAAGSELAANDGLIFATGTERNDAAGAPVWSLLAYEADTGKLRWSLDLAAIPGSPVYFGGVVYVADASGVVTAVNAADGALRWQQPLPDGTQPIALSIDATRLFVTTASGTLLVVDTGSPSSISTLTPPKGSSYWSPVVIGQTLFVAAARVDESAGGYPAATIRAFDLANANARLWTRSYTGDIGRLVAFDGRLFTTIPVQRRSFDTSSPYGLVQLDPQTGATNWTYEYISAGFGEIVPITSPQPILAVPGAGNVLYGFSPETGAHSWAMGSLSVVRMVASKSGTLYAVLDDGTLISILPAPGSATPIVQQHTRY